MRITDGRSASEVNQVNSPLIKKEHIDILEVQKRAKGRALRNQGVGKTQNLTITQEQFTRARSNPCQAKVKPSSATLKERREGRMKDALALGGDEGRDKLR